MRKHKVNINSIKIVKKCLIPSQGKVEYLALWDSFPKEEASWNAKENVTFWQLPGTYGVLNVS